VRHFNDVHGRSGTLWEGRYRATLIDTARYLLVCQRYIELNPVRAGISERPEDYPWSSYHANAMGVRDPLITPHRLYLALGTDADRLEAYRSLSQTPLDQPRLEQIREATNKGWALGEAEAFEGGLGLNRRTKPRPAGRPRRRKPTTQLIGV
jgi:putative transposase